MKVNVMRKPFQAALGLAIVLGNSQLIFAAPRGEPTACHGRAISDLQRLSAHGYAVYQAMADKKQFLTWVACDDIQTELSTGVHELVHVLTEMKDGYPLIGGGLVRRPHEVSHFFPPKDIAKSLDARDAYVQTILDPTAPHRKATSCICSTATTPTVTISTRRLRWFRCSFAIARSTTVTGSRQS